MATLSRIGCAAAAAALASAQSYKWQEKWTTAWVDNFNAWGSLSTSTFQLRYLINDTWWGGPTHPILFYTGNEGDVTLFAENSGLLWELAPKLQALVVFAEHRYYGETMPFGSASYDTPNLAYLSSEQALADYAGVIDSLKANLSAPLAPVVAFGGSYGGMLAAWFRQKYPAAVVGAIAASAPVRQFTGIVDPKAFNAIITADYAGANPVAPQAIYNSWGQMTQMANSQSGRNQIRGLLGICDQLNQPSDVTSTVFNWLTNAIGFMAMGDYPYPANFVGPLPAWPINVSASYFTDPNAPPEKLLPAIRAGIANLYYNFTGQAGSCFNLSSLNPPGLTGNGWDVQSCTEMVMPIGQYGLPSDMFYYAPWDLTATIQGCQQEFGTTPRPNMARIQYGVTDLSGVSNIVFSNGHLDPWSGGGVLQNVTGNPSIIAVIIEQGAHHLDLRGSHPMDPPSVINARAIEAAAIQTWLLQHYEAADIEAPSAVRKFSW